jgi:hypothetical protein
MSSSYRRHKLWVWAGVWLLTRAAMVVQVGVWNNATGLQLEDILTYEPWSNQLATEHLLPPAKLGNTRPAPPCC